MRKGLVVWEAMCISANRSSDSDFLAIVIPGAGLSPALIASASLTYLPFLLLPLVAVAIPLVAVAVAVPLITVVAVPLVAAVVTVPLVAVAVALIAVVAVRIVPIRGIPVDEWRTISTGKDELVTTAPIATAPVAAAAECRSASGRHRHVPMAMAATTTPRSSVYRRRG